MKKEMCAKHPDCKLQGKGRICVVCAWRGIVRAV